LDQPAKIKFKKDQETLGGEEGHAGGEKEQAA
jgi:hypothetical protein